MRILTAAVAFVALPLALALSQHQDHDQSPLANNAPPPAGLQAGFTMMIATFKRDDLLPDLLHHLTTTPPPSLRQILVVWQNIDVPLPPCLSPSALDDYSLSGVPVSVRLSRVNSMNERFRPLLDWAEPVKTHAVMIMDDDIILRRQSLEWGYQEFLAANPIGSPVDSGKIVGFSGRDFEWGDDGWKYTVQPQRSYSIVLSNAAWFKTEWLERYWGDDTEMLGLRKYVDKVFNCDDLLINYVVSNMTHLPPLLLQLSTPLRTVPTTDGLWNRDPSSDPTTSPGTSPTLDHFTQRQHCLSYYFSHFARHAPSSLHPSTAKHYPLLRSSTAHTQDITDHARWLHPDETWEQQHYTRVLTPEEEEKQQFDALLDGMTEDELDALLARMAEEDAEEKRERERAEEEEDDEDEEPPMSEFEAAVLHARLTKEEAELDALLDREEAIPPEEQDIAIARILDEL